MRIGALPLTECKNAAVPTDRRVPADRSILHTGSQVGDSALVWHVIEDAFFVVCAADSHLDEDFVGLTVGQQHLAVLSLVWAEIMSGGIFAPLDNPAGNFLPEAIAAARAVGADATTQLLESIVDLLGLSLTDVRDQGLRNEALDRHEDSGDHPDLDSLAALASEWFDCSERFIESNRDEFFS